MQGLSESDRSVNSHLRSAWERLLELFATAETSAPNGGVVGSVASSGGVIIRFAPWRQTTRRCRGTVCVVQGRSEFIEKYYEVITNLRQRGFAVLAFDWRGQGGSDRLL